MNSIILQTASRFLFPVMVLYSVFLLLRGHDAPGGGFAGGLLAAGAFVLQAIAFGPAKARHILRMDPHRLLGVGLLLVTLSGIAGLAAGHAFQTGILWGELKLAEHLNLGFGTPTIFDAGVYLAVLGAACLAIFSMMEEVT